MSGKKLHLSIVSPADSCYEGDADTVVVPTSEGLIGVLPGHISLLALLGYGILTFREGSETRSFVIDGGFLEIRDDRVSVLANSVEDTKDVDPEKAQKDFEAALQLKATGEEEMEERQARLASARTRLRAGSTGRQ